MPLSIFVDSDVVISSLLSSTGAASFLIHQTQDIKLFVSNLSQTELEIVTTRLGIPWNTLKALVEKKFEVVNLKRSATEAKKEYKDYVVDIDDALIVLGAKEARVKFLITYNIKHFKSDKIKQDFNILVMTPGQFIQYLRSLQ